MRKNVEEGKWSDNFVVLYVSFSWEERERRRRERERESDVFSFLFLIFIPVSFHLIRSLVCFGPFILHTHLVLFWTLLVLSHCLFYLLLLLSVPFLDKLSSHLHSLLAHLISDFSLLPLLLFVCMYYLSPMIGKKWIQLQSNVAPVVVGMISKGKALFSLSLQPDIKRGKRHEARSECIEAKNVDCFHSTG